MKDQQQQKREPRRDDDRAQAWRRIAEETAREAEKAPERYLDETKVPTGGE